MNIRPPKRITVTLDQESGDALMALCEMDRRYPKQEIVSLILSEFERRTIKGDFETDRGRFKILPIVERLGNNLNLLYPVKFLRFEGVPRKGDWVMLEDENHKVITSKVDDIIWFNSVNTHKADVLKCYVVVQFEPGRLRWVNSSQKGES